MLPHHDIVWVSLGTVGTLSHRRNYNGGCNSVQRLLSKEKNTGKNEWRAQLVLLASKPRL